MDRNIPEIPQTIEQLRAWYTAHNLPPEEVTRFFIGKDIREPKAFGIYKDGDRFVVYKNKEDGSRAVRYHGPDEAYAVRELYLKLKSEIAARKNPSGSGADQKSDPYMRIAAATLIFFIVLTVFLFFFSDNTEHGYYLCDDSWYYYKDVWYGYDDGGYWYPTDVPEKLQENAPEYYESETHGTQTPGVPFEETEYYRNTDTDSTWDSSDSWDSGSTDWSSDW